MTRQALERRGLGAALILYAAWELRGFLGPGLPAFFDFASHVARTWFVSEALGQGEFPGWSNFWYGGYRALEFYSPVYYWISGTLAWLLGDPLVATKLCLWLGLLALVTATYQWLNRLVPSPWIAFAGAVLLLKSPLVRWIFGSVGNLPSLLAVLGLSLLLTHLGRHAGGSPARLGVGAALIVAFMLAGHLSNALLLLAGAGAFAVVACWQQRETAAAFGRRMLALALAGAAALLLTAFVWLPAWLDLDVAALSLVREAPAAFRFELRPIRIAAGLEGFSWEYSKVRDHGPRLVQASLLLALLSLAPGARRWRPVAAGFAATLLASPLAEGRGLMALAFYMSGLTALGGAALVAGVARRSPLGARGLAAVAVLAAVAWPGQERGFPVPRYLPDASLGLYERLPRDGPGRVFDLGFDHDRLDAFYGSSCLSPYLSGRAIPFGGFPQGAHVDTNLSMAAASPWTHERTRSPAEWSESGLDVLALLGVELLVERSGSARFGGAPSERGTQLEPGVFRLAHASPALFSRRISPLPESFATGATDPARNPLIDHLVEHWRASRGDLDDFRRHAAFSPVTFTRDGKDWGLGTLVEAMDLDRARRSARTFFAARAERTRIAPGTAPAQPELRVLEHREALQQAALVVRSSSPGFVRVAYSYDPELRVTLDGEPVEILADALGGAFLLALPAGTHRIEIRPPPFALRKALVLASLPGWVLGVAIFVATRPGRPAQAVPASRGSAEMSARVPTA